LPGKIAGRPRWRQRRREGIINTAPAHGEKDEPWQAKFIAVRIYQEGPMAESDQHPKVAIIVAPGFEESEMTEPRKFLISHGAKTLLISLQPGKVQAMKHDEKSAKYPVDKTLDQVDPGDFDALLLPGGALNADRLRVEKKARRFVQAMDKAGKPIAIICHAPWLLVSAGLVKGRKLTSYHTIRDDIENAGGKWVDAAVVVDGNLVTSRQPSDIPKFNAKIKKLFWAPK
jgi:protease I